MSTATPTRTSHPQAARVSRHRPTTMALERIWIVMGVAFACGVALVARALGAPGGVALLIGVLGLASAIVCRSVLISPWRAATDQIDQAALRAMTPAAFERLASDLFQRAGYQVRHVGASGDGGVDVRVWRGGRSGIVQCKRYHGEHAVGPATIRELMGARIYERADAAWLVTTGRVTAGARTLAAEAGIGVLDADVLIAWEGRLRRRWRIAGSQMP
jgi:HJR/Mrr/RecB family endonuclease